LHGVLLNRAIGCRRSVHAHNVADPRDGGVGRVSVGLIGSSRRLWRPDGGEGVDGEFVVAGGA